ncbi:MAG: hypothetical protein ACHQXA_04740 [Gemmatimonadales bacterium]
MLLRRPLPLLSIILTLTATSVVAQTPRVLPSTTPAWYQGIEAVRLYFVRGLDTTEVRGTAPRIARLVWSPERKGGGSALVVTTTALDVHRGITTDTLRLDSAGNVSTITGDSAATRDRYALLLRLPVPPGALDSGATWGDTAATGWPAPGVRTLSARVESYHVTGETDTLGSKVVVIHVTGTARYRESRWIDSTARTSYWVDASGPMDETWWLDPAHGELLARRRQLSLRGIGTFPDNGLTDTVPAGFQADDAWGRIDAGRAAVLARPLPGSDSSWTVTPEPALLHTVHRLGQVVESALARNDGTVGTSLLETAAGRPRQYQALWTTPGDPDLSLLVRVHDDSLTLNGARSWPIPAGPWAVAEEGMEEQLIPVLVSLPADSDSVALPVFRPRAARWDTLQVLRKPLFADVVLYLFSSGGPRTRGVIMVTAAGDLLTVERATDPPSRRLPMPGTARRARLDQIFDQLQGSH